MSLQKSLSILLIEDDEADVVVVQDAFKKNNITNPLWVAANGLEALAVLREGKFPERDRLILLDLDTPTMNGIDFLRELRADPKLASTPVVVLTNSNAERKEVDVSELDVNGYVSKPVTFPKLVELMSALDKYWTLVERP